MARISATLGLTALALALAACGGKADAPKGQVVATVNDQEVTLQEVNTELQSANIPQGMSREDAQKQALQRVIDRKLFAAEATTRGLDKTPAFITEKMKVDESLLAQQLVKQQAQAITQPTPAEIASFKSENPNIFAQRQQLAVDQIRFQPPNQEVLKELESVNSQDGVAAALRARNVPFQRGRATIDTAVLPPAVVKQINALPATEPFVLPGRGFLTVNIITGRTAAPIDDAQANQIATNGWRERKFGTSVQDRLAQLKKAAKITYQPGFAPPADAKPAAGAPATPAS